MTPEFVRRWQRWREGVRGRRIANLVYRGVIGVVGVLVLAVGIVTIPYPGPGWAIVFLGLGILATEFSWARRLLGYARERYDRFMAWFWLQGLWIQILGALFTAAVVMTTLWVLGAVAWGAGLVGIEWPWLNSPLGIGS
ncbi:TIGR02611 family protein [[Mycobacterium] burgundiense]|uniref:TIGR02611 family protein n=1 Tax=[Mycobacterium] burgundiense TaxID=3064286 RepID=A0ABM9LV34_9MYCO|nr:TIGR02611 family protein [Mycolicibacterium sp. MU0053]CAJ1505201.1 TIGR02611 family protein [Mycolicibacterium sp. MU0053]